VSENNGLAFAEDSFIILALWMPSRSLEYARVSTFGQTLEAQLEQLAAAGCDRVYRETASGARADRRELNRLGPETSSS
jgi:predicted site-specific integrase-resolvase